MRLNGLQERVRAVTCDVVVPRGLRRRRSCRRRHRPRADEPALQRRRPAERLAGSGAAAWRMPPVPACCARWAPIGRRTCSSAQATLTLIWRADALGDVLAALRPRFGAVAVDAGAAGAGRAGYPDSGAGGEGGGAGDAGLSRASSAMTRQARPSAAAEAVVRGGEPLAIAEWLPACPPVAASLA